MKKIHVILIGILFLFTVAFSNRYFATTWAGTASNQMVTRQALNDAVTNGIFTAKQSFPSDSRVVTKSMAQQYVNINTISGYEMNQLVPKSSFVSATTYYYHAISGACGYNSPKTQLAGYPSSSDALSRGTTDFSPGYVWTIYNRPLAVGDEVFANNSAFYPTVYNSDSYVGGGCAAGSRAYWVYSDELNAAVEVTNTNTGRQYILSIVYPPSLTNVSICLEVIYDATNQVSVVANATSLVDTNITINFQYSINGDTYTSGSALTINSGYDHSGYTTVMHSGTISSFDIIIDGFSTVSSSTQNYVSGGQCF